MWERTLGSMAAALVLAGTLTAARAGDYVFTKIAEQGDGPVLQGGSTLTFPVINGHGEVQFTATGPKNRNIVWVGNGLTLRAAVALRSFKKALTAEAGPLNDAGTFAVTTRYDAQPDQNSNGDRGIGPGGVFTVGRGGSVTEIVRVDGQSAGQGYPFRAPHMDNNGRVIWHQHEVDTISQTIIEPPRIVRDAAVPLFSDINYKTFFALQVSGSGRIICLATLLNGRDRLLRLDPAAPSNPVTIASEEATFVGLSTASVSNSGRVAFLATVPSGRTGLYTGDGTGNPTEVVHVDRGPFPSLTSVSINDLNQIVFTGLDPGLDPSRDGPSTSLFDGTNPASDRVIGPGDMLGGRPVVRIAIGPESYNSAGQIALIAAFDDGSGAIYRADPASLGVPPGTVRSAFVPTKVRLTPTALTVKGGFDAGGLPFDVSSPGHLIFNGSTIAVSVQISKGGSRTELTGDGVELSLTQPADGGSRGKFALSATGDALQNLDPDQPLELHLVVGSVDAEGSVPLTGGKYRKKDGVLGPRAYPLAAKFKLAKPGKHALSLTLAAPALGDAPAAGEDVMLEFGSAFADQFTGSSLRRKGDRYEFREGSRRVVVDYARKTISYATSRLDLDPSFTTGRTVTVKLTVGGLVETLAFRVRGKKTTFKY